ncbi:MAG: DEAD/DEAH box helicase [Candidatus Magasanikbacteria bacterium]
MPTFKELGLNSNLLRSLDDLGFITPSPIQEKAIPYLLNSTNDLIALAQTGTGKTAAFSLPILQQLNTGNRNIQAIILCPTRELCLQISEDIKRYAKYSKEISITAVYGGARMDLQMKSIKNGTHIVVGTPGRVHDLIRRRILKLQTVDWVVLDEADQMLDMGFKEDLDAILAQTPVEKQTLLFSATMSQSIAMIARKYMSHIEEISIGEKNKGATNVSHEYYLVDHQNRFEALQRVIDSLPNLYGIIFCRTKMETQEIADKLRMKHYDAEALHGDVSQNIRTKIMGKFKNKEISLLVATDVAARGIDVNDLTHIINYNLPDVSEAYTHRSGRTGRADKTGISLSIIVPRELGKLKRIESIIGKKIEYKKIPNGEEIYFKQVETFINEVENGNVDNLQKEKSFSHIFEKLDSLSKEDLIHYIISQKLKHLILETDRNHDLNTNSKFSSDFSSDGKKNGRRRNRSKRHVDTPSNYSYREEVFGGRSRGNSRGGNSFRKKRSR